MSLDSFARGLIRAAFKGRLLRRRLPRSVGGAIVYVAPDSQLKYLRPGVSGFDKDLINWARRYVRPDNAVWDIGANCGVFAMAAAGLGAQVLAVEPDPFLADALLRARAANPGLRVEVMAAAVSEARGITTLQFASGGRAANALEAFAGTHVPFGASAGRMLTPTVRLDDLLGISAPTLVKLDVEGAELLALRGASRLLAEVRPTLIVEVDSSQWEEVGHLLSQAGYLLCDPDEPDRPVLEPLFNVLARPK
jgi:FkbM family methyltransferase